ncbi:hypothetical protein [Thalassospira lohafexi]|uniref:Uncharacterized protein n=1 Tax=Thalassospira lohafexi TaxID=744227 RepID=A0A2N3L3S9_9PROT|nr:hypothetical protein [Thalassospira lohafexi]PKR57474.1 hypothetical protein COO92_16160 [Thalassospira lohafexi]
MPKPNSKPAKNGHPLMQDPVENQRKTFDDYMKRTKTANTTLAALTGLRESTFRNYRNATTRDMTLETKIKAANALHMPLTDLFGPTLGLTSRRDTPRFPDDGPANTEPATRESKHSMVPVYGRVNAGRMVNTPYPVAFVEVPATVGLSESAFAVSMAAADMVPRFKMYEVLIANPEENTAVGDDCVIILTSGEIRILQCMEYTADRGFTGTSYADPQLKVSIKSNDIDRIGRVSYIRT